MGTIVRPEDCSSISLAKIAANKGMISGASVARQSGQSTQPSALTWTEKFRPKVPGDIIGNQSLVCVNHNFSSFLLFNLYLSCNEIWIGNT